jgi:hypothetical protein
LVFFILKSGCAKSVGNVEKLTCPRKSYKANNATELESEMSLYLDIGLREKWRHVAVSGYWSAGEMTRC